MVGVSLGIGGIPSYSDREGNGPQSLETGVQITLLYKSRTKICSRHSAVSLCIERFKTMAELTDQEMNEHMDDYEQVSN